ncbi:hypothetical protein EDC65_2121 [Stella humosa]|uniref:Phosphatidate cytidylyltransferase n=1 Tax=Stella humosa TaxID=94 RepID=A0A3N1MB87_9PROT|nr:hypothetical protein [Stella humosa]ROQ00325.1 hypothetical protein EDC65_2121 [Stella humosa]BBK30436.1 hypothetical protein STHU_10700 [Stella humosa]
MIDPLDRLVGRELSRPVPAPAIALARHLADRSPSVAAVLFYGAALRDGDMDGLLDFYVLVDSLADWHGSRWRATANRLLPPNVSYAEVAHEGRMVRAKVAVMGVDQFARAAGFAGADSTIWARFAQPAALPYCRDEATRGRVSAAIGDAIVTAARWAALLGPLAGGPLVYWRALFANTYRAELRVEGAGRSDLIVGSAPDRYQRLLAPAWDRAGIATVEHPDGTISPLIPDVDRRAAALAWGRRVRVGKVLNILRLTKAAFTFVDGGHYLAWKIERHTGTRLALTPWQLRHPVLAGPFLLFRLWRRGVVR